MSKPPDGSAGRKPPPVQHRFLKGTSGNPRGRPRGTVSLERMTRDFALQQQRVTVGGKAQWLSRLEITILKLQALAASGTPSAVPLLHELRLRLAPEAPDDKQGTLLVPETATLEEFLAAEEERNKDRVEPGTEVNVEAEEFIKAVRGEPSPLGEALLAFHRKYRQNPNQES